MKIKYYDGTKERVEVVNDLYKDVAVLLAAEPIEHPVEIEIKNCLNQDEFLKYRISVRSGTRFIVELANTMPDCYLPAQVKPVFLTCVDPYKNAYKFYKLQQVNNCVRASYGRMGVQKGNLFGEREFDYPLSMFWIKYYEKLSKGYIDRSDLYLVEKENKQKKQPKPVKKGNDASSELFEKLKQFAVHAVKKAEVKVPITDAILKRSKELLNQMRDSKNVMEFNNNLLELISILQRPVATGNGSGVLNIMAKSKVDFESIILRENDLIQAMEGSYYGNTKDSSGSFEDYNIEVYWARNLFCSIICKIMELH